MPKVNFYYNIKEDAHNWAYFLSLKESVFGMSKQSMWGSTKNDLKKILKNKSKK